MVEDGILYKHTQKVDKMIKVKMYSLIKRNFFWKGKCKDIDIFIQKWHTCKQHNLQKQSYSYIHMKPGKRPFDSILCNLFSCFHSPSSKGKSYVLMCVPSNYLPNSGPHTKEIHKNNHTSISKTCIHHFGDSLTMMLDNGKEFRNELFQKLAGKLDIAIYF